MSAILPIDCVSSVQVCAQAERRLRESPYYFLRQLSCRFDRGVLTLAGHVPYPQLRPIAEAIVSRVPGVRVVDNRVEVHDPSQATFLAPAARNAG